MVAGIERWVTGLKRHLSISGVIVITTCCCVSGLLGILGLLGLAGLL